MKLPALIVGLVIAGVATTWATAQRADGTTDKDSGVQSLLELSKRLEEVGDLAGAQTCREAAGRLARMTNTRFGGGRGRGPSAGSTSFSSTNGVGRGSGGGGGGFRASSAPAATTDSSGVDERRFGGAIASGGGAGGGRARFGADEGSNSGGGGRVGRGRGLFSGTGGGRAGEGSTGRAAAGVFGRGSGGGGTSFSRRSSGIAAGTADEPSRSHAPAAGIGTSAVAETAPTDETTSVFRGAWSRSATPATQGACQDDVRSLLKQMHQEILELRREVRELKNLLHSRSKAKSSDLRIVEDAPLSTDDLKRPRKPAAKRPDMRGEILATDFESGVVVVLLEEEAPLREGMTCHVARDDTYLGELRIAQVVDDKAIAYVDRKLEGLEIAKGDVVFADE